jgi:hypothetical protein
MATKIFDVMAEEFDHRNPKPVEQAAENAISI